MNITNVLWIIALVLAIIIMLVVIWRNVSVDDKASASSAGGPKFLVLPEVGTFAPVARLPLPTEVGLRVFQYATGDHEIQIACADNPASGHVHTAPRYNLAVDRPFQYRIEPRWRGGSEVLDVIHETKVDADILPSQPMGDGFSSQWTELVHHGPQVANRELAQTGQHVTMGRGPVLHPMAGRPIEFHFRVDFQLGAQNGPKRVCEGRVYVSRAP